MRTPAALAALPLLLGSAAGILLSDHPDHWLPLSAAAAALLSFIAAFALLVDDSVDGFAVAVATGCLMTGVSLGLGAARAAYQPPLLTWFAARDAALRDEPALVEGVLREDASPSPFGASISLDVRCVEHDGSCTGGRSLGGVRLAVGGASVAEEAGEWREGRILRLPATLRRPVLYGDPGLPDDVRALARRGIVLVGSVKSAALVEVLQRGSAIQEIAASARAWGRRELKRYVGGWSVQSGAIAAAILIGDRSGLSDADERRLQEAGIYHVIAISGGNIAILTAMLLVALRLVRMPHHAAAGLAIAALLFYGQLTGGGASVSRAVTAACVYLGGRILDHRGPPLNALAVAAVAALALSPLAAFDGGFLLSFGATLGILLGAPRLRWGPRSPDRTARPSERPGSPAGTLAASGAEAGRKTAATKATNHGFPRTLSSRTMVLLDAVLRSRIVARAASAAWGLLAATICAELALAPIGAVLFSRITVAGLLLNFAAIPLMAIAQAGAIATLAAAAVAGPAARVCGYITHLAASWIVRSAGLMDVAPWLSRDVTPPAWWLVGAYYASCATLLACPRRTRTAACGVAVSAALMLAGPAAVRQAGVPARAPDHLRVVFLDVGQGDSTLAVLPDGRALLVDAGGLAGSTFDIGSRVVAPSLRALGVRRLETLVVTHGDPDHIGGAAAVLRQFAPRTVWEGVPVPPHPGLRELRAVASRSAVSWRTVQAGDRETIGGVEIRVLHPPPPDWERQRVRNDDSVVLELRLGDVSFVLPGDIGVEGERLVVARLTPGRLAIVKAPHHGSATSSTPPFIDAAHPSAVVFSEGRGNRFGHPAPDVAARYRGAKAAVFRTDEDGAVTMDTEGTTVEVTTWSGRRVTLR